MCPDAGVNATAGYLNSVERLLVYGPAFANIPADQRERVMKHYATVELTDGANQHGLEAIGSIRVSVAGERRHNRAQVNTALA